jgi:transposase
MVPPVVIEFPVSGLTAAQRTQYAAHLFEHEMTLNRLSVFETEHLKSNLLNYPNVERQLERSRRLARGYLRRNSGNRAAHSLDVVAGGYLYEFSGIRGGFQDQIGALWRTRVQQIQPGAQHQLVPVFLDNLP